MWDKKIAEWSYKRGHFTDLRSVFQLIESTF